MYDIDGVVIFKLFLIDLFGVWFGILKVVSENYYSWIIIGLCLMFE